MSIGTPKVALRWTLVQNRAAISDREHTATACPRETVAPGHDSRPGPNVRISNQQRNRRPQRCPAPRRSGASFGLDLLSPQHIAAMEYDGIRWDATREWLPERNSLRTAPQVYLRIATRPVAVPSMDSTR